VVFILIKDQIQKGNETMERIAIVRNGKVVALYLREDPDEHDVKHTLIRLGFREEFLVESGDPCNTFEVNKYNLKTEVKIDENLASRLVEIRDIVGDPDNEFDNCLGRVCPFLGSVQPGDEMRVVELHHSHYAGGAQALEIDGYDQKVWLKIENIVRTIGPDSGRALSYDDLE